VVASLLVGGGAYATATSSDATTAMTMVSGVRPRVKFLM